VLVRALERSPEIRDEELIEFCRSHIITLQTRLSDAQKKTYWISFYRNVTPCYQDTIISPEFVKVTANDLQDAIAIARKSFPETEWKFHASTVDND